MNESLFLASSMILVLIILLPLSFHFSKHLGVHSDNDRKNEPVEGGIRLNKTIKNPADAFNVKFFLVGIIFIIFDVEVLFMFPWALNLRELGLFALIEMFVFLALLIGGLIYVYKSGVLKWT